MAHKILIIGAAGKFGGWAIPLLSDSYELTLTDRKAGELNGRTIHELDITDYHAVLAAMQGMDAVVNLAICSQREFVTDSDRFDADEGEEYLRFNEASIEVNVRGTYHIFEAARQAGVNRVIFGSSLTVYLGAPSYPEINDTLPARPFNFYAVTKLWGENLGELFARKHGLTVYSLRFGQPYPLQNDPKECARLETPAGKRASVTFVDIAGALECALKTTTGPAFGAYTIVSAAKDSRFDCFKAEEIGWKSKTLCHDDGSITPITD